jgi:hypothetical protein
MRRAGLRPDASVDPAGSGQVVRGADLLARSADEEFVAAVCENHHVFGDPITVSWRHAGYRAISPDDFCRR